VAPGGSPFGGPVNVLAAEAPSAAQMVEQRQRLMREDGQLLKGLRDFPADGDITVLNQLLANLKTLPTLFPKGSNTGKSNALPLIWKQPEAFADMFHEAEITASAMLQAVKSGDESFYADAFRGLAAACGECHQVYRAQLD
jgi:cytochrome c556